MANRMCCGDSFGMKIELKSFIRASTHHDKSTDPALIMGKTTLLVI